MTDKEFLEKLEHDHVDKAEYLAQESEAETRKKNFANLSLKRLEALEDDTWKRVIHIDESLEVMRKRINEIYYYDAREMSPERKIGMIAALLEYEQRLIAARRKLTDNVVRTITDREKTALRVDGVKKGGFGGSEEE